MAATGLCARSPSAIPRPESELAERPRGCARPSGARGGVFAAPGLLASLSVLVSELGGPLQRVGCPEQDRGELLGAVSCMRHDEIAGVCRYLGSVSVSQLGPAALQQRSTSFVLSHLTLKSGPFDVPRLSQNVSARSWFSAAISWPSAASRGPPTSLS
jgi:hypothetical protein